MKYCLSVLLIAQFAFAQEGQVPSLENKQVVVAVLAPAEIEKQVEGTTLRPVNINGEIFILKRNGDETFLQKNEANGGKVKVNKHGIYFFDPIDGEPGEDSGSFLQRQGWFNLGLALGGITHGSFNGLPGTRAGTGPNFEATLSYRPLQYKHLNTGVNLSKAKGPDTNFTSVDPRDFEIGGAFRSSGREFFIEHDVIAGGGGHDRDTEIDAIWALSGGYYWGSYGMKEYVPTLVESTNTTVNGVTTTKQIQFSTRNIDRASDKGIFVRGRLVINGGNIFVRYDHGQSRKFTSGVTFSFGGPGSLVH